MKGHKIFIIPLLFICLIGCSSEKRIGHDAAIKRADNYNKTILEAYNDKLDVTTVWTIETSGAYAAGGDLADSVPSLEDETSNASTEQYFYSKDKIEKISTKVTTSNGIETTNKFYAYLKTGLKLVAYSKIKTKTNGVSYTGFESLTTYIFDDGRVEKIVKEREIKTSSNSDDFNFAGHYHYVGNISLSWVAL